MNFLSITWWRSISQKLGRSVGWGCMLIIGIPLVISFGGWSFNRYNNRGANGSQPDEAGTLVTVNGDVISQKDFLSLAASQQTAQPGREYATQQGEIVNALIQHKLLTEMAKAVNVRPSDADVDREVASKREQFMGAKSSQSDWENFLDDRLHTNPEEFRERIADSLVAKTLLDHAKTQEKVTPEEAKQQSGEVHLNVVAIPTPNMTPMLATPPSAKTLPDADAKKKAEDLLAKVKAGADIAKIAKENSGDPSAGKGGEMDWAHEYEGSPFQAYGKDFLDAIHKTPTGQFTDVIRLGGMKSGYVFAKIVDRRNTLPKDYDEKKVIDQLQQQRAGEKLGKDLKKNLKTAKLVFAKDAEDKKAYYDFYKYMAMEQDQMMAQFGQAVDDPPTPAEVAAQKSLADTEIDGVYQRHAKDSSNDGATAALLMADDLKGKLAQTPPAEQPQVRDRLINLYLTALKTTENREMRFDLAKLYVEKKDLDSAEAEYKKIAGQLSANPPFDLDTMRDSMKAHQELYQGFRSLDTPIAPRPSASEAAKKQQDAMAALKPRLDREEQKAAEEQKKKAAQPATPQGLPPGLSLPGGGAPATGAAPSGGNPASATPSKDTTQPSGAPKSGTTPGGSNRSTTSHAPAASGMPGSAGQPGRAK